jgi:hypothetical protein
MGIACCVRPSQAQQNLPQPSRGQEFAHAGYSCPLGHFTLVSRAESNLLVSAAGFKPVCVLARDLLPFALAASEAHVVHYARGTRLL